MTRLNGKIAFVTGAGGGIGRAICERFLAEGSSVAAADINPDLDGLFSSAEAEGRFIVLRCDVGDSDSVRNAIAHTVEAFGSLNVICNVAGGSTSQDGCVTEAPESEFWRAIKLDLFGTFVCCKHGLPELIKAGGGSVINMASMVALMAVPHRDCYTAAKGGVLALTRSMAAGYARHAIRVNAIAPGITRTPRVQAYLNANSGENSLAARHLLGLAEPIDIAHLAVYLASDESRVVTGQVLAVDSGVTIC
ncbi:SDR family NAD(P)-dependent oxidoreductase [Paraburkholderia sp. NPDC080076]|uniref:SDR family NAD(P)-dependent oxidoreductase n=1 Tax=Paraburkholderia sp. NPDC080076 TaxID=3390605 RepID=UPI003D018948